MISENDCLVQQWFQKWFKNNYSDDFPFKDVKASCGSITFAKNRIKAIIESESNETVLDCRDVKRITHIKTKAINLSCISELSI